MAFSYLPLVLLSALLCIVAARQECLSVRGHARCGPGSHRQQQQHHAGDFGRGRHGQHGGHGGHGGHGRDEYDDFEGSRDRGPPIFVKLFDEDRGGPDDWMDDGYASKTGAFQLHGCASDGLLGGSIEPVIYFYHKCKGTGKRVRFELPQAAINTEYNITREFRLDLPQQTEEVDDEYPAPTCSSVRRSGGRF